ncbi:MAG: hypothetical protein UGF89_06535 [Acutalibacteraceae bacterium]|nr:hypothetical protein [Acutalibacteraceae bacterium]
MKKNVLDFAKEAADIVARAVIGTIFITLCIMIFCVAFAFVVTRLGLPWIY